MLKYFFLLLISLTCLASEPKFHFMDCVKIVKGFYKGCQGKVTTYLEGGGPYPSSYDVQVEDCRNGTFSTSFDENELEGCKK